ncbi:MAG: deoxyribose-phosphate aldolase [Marinilabiliaceae bacterium]|nr:deoxyribose-phosphate aldolase [Marinilabiliaceae bacterium]
MDSLFEQYQEDFDSMPKFGTHFVRSNNNIETLKEIFNCVDLTSLNTDDSYSSVKLFCEKVRDFPTHYQDIPNVAAVCTFSKYASILKRILGETNVKRAVVSAGFPSSQIAIQHKIDETKDAIFNGANEIDIVISVGEFFDKKYEIVCQEINALKIKTAKLKVILETGILKTPENIWKASLLAMESGADFIKTSTGKSSVSATPEAVWVMTHAIKVFNAKNGKKIGIKPSGGIVSVDDALLFHSIVKNVLGEKYMNNQLLRFGASRLANNILTEIEKLKGNDRVVSYF